MKIIVLAGGTSTEREISIVTGTQVAKALRARGHRAVMIDVFTGLKDADPEHIFEGDYDVEEAAEAIRACDAQIPELVKCRKQFFGPMVLELCAAADAVFMALHGSNGEDGKIQAVFDLLGIPYTGSGYLGSALAMDKEMSKQLFRENKVPTPDEMILRRGERLLPASRSPVGLPCVVKPACGGSSVGVSIARTQEEYEEAVREGFRYEDVLIVETYIQGREFSVGMIDGEAYPVIEIAPLQGFYDYHNKYVAGSTVETCPADLPQELSDRMQKAALSACAALKVDSYGRVDFMMDEAENIYCLEVNTLPGMTPTSLLPQEAAAAGMDFPALCEKLIEVSLRSRR